MPRVDVIPEDPELAALWRLLAEFGVKSAELSMVSLPDALFVLVTAPDARGPGLTVRAISRAELRDRVRRRLVHRLPTAREILGFPGDDS